MITFSEHNYTNVNVATPEGIARALNLGLVPSHLSDTLVSAHVDLIPSLFNANDRARAFVMFRVRSPSTCWQLWQSQMTLISLLVLSTR